MTDKSIAVHTPGPWMVPHFARDDIKCNCASVLVEQYCGAIAKVHFDNGKSIAEGGNDCPPIEEAKANARLIAAAPDLLAASEVALGIMNLMGWDGDPVAENLRTSIAKVAGVRP